MNELSELNELKRGRRRLPLDSRDRKEGGGSWFFSVLTRNSNISRNRGGDAVTFATTITLELSVSICLLILLISIRCHSRHLTNHLTTIHCWKKERKGKRQTE